ncbi:MAG: ester cyclase [Geodermatophilaceae bacterium]
MSRETNVAAQEKFGEAINSAKFEAFDDVVAPDSVDHDPAPGQGPGPAGYRAMFAELRTAFPDLKVEVEHLTATDDDVALAYTATGTHDGELQGHAPTGKQVSFRGVQIGRFENGKLVERWGSSDQLGMLSQLGLAE